MMKLVTRLLILGSVLGSAFAAGMLVSRRRAARALHAGPARPDDDLARRQDADIVEPDVVIEDIVIEDIVIVGLADVDPDGLMGFGEVT